MSSANIWNWHRHMDFVDYIQGHRLGPIAPEIGSAQRGVKQLERTVAELELRVQRLSAICRALWLLLRDSTGLSEEDLLAKLEEAEAETGGDDGLSGRAPTSVVRCAQCGKVNKSERPTCLYCGTALESKKSGRTEP
jgi:hypothetical protein